MKFIQSKKDGSCFLEFSEEEREIIKNKKGLFLSAASLRHFTNNLVNLAAELHNNFDEDTKHLTTNETTKIAGKYVFIR